MRTRLVLPIILTCSSLLTPALAGAATRQARPTPPTRAQIARALARAERSRSLWATINICNTKHHPNVVGVRGQMPALGFASLLSMEVELQYWSVIEKRYKPLTDTRQTLSLGAERQGLHQSGVSFSFSPHAGTLAGIVRFDWRLGHRSIGHAVRATASGHPDADQGDPAHFSAGKCDLS